MRAEVVTRVELPTVAALQCLGPLNHTLEWFHLVALGLELLAAILNFVQRTAEVSICLQDGLFVGLPRYLDFQRAFDSVMNDSLIFKLAPKASDLIFKALLFSREVIKHCLFLCF
jgi:hypothetical protein